jgi:hypothetical protein
MEDQKDISDKQAEISSSSLKLTQSMYELTKLPDLQRQYKPLEKTRFWRSLQSAYGTYKEAARLEESLDSLIDEAGFPPTLDPSKAGDLQQLVLEHQEDWKEIKLWGFARALYPYQYDQDHEPEIIRLHNRIKHETRENLRVNRESLVRFWEEWLPQFVDIRMYLPRRPRDSEELIVLVWLKLAYVRATGDFGRPGEKEFLKSAKAEWEAYRRSADQSDDDA